MNMKLIVLVWMLGLLGCRTGMIPVTQRPLGLKDQPTGEMVVRGRKISKPAKPPEIFVKQDRLVINPVAKQNTSGSLYDLEDPRNILFVEKPRGALATYLEIEVVSNRLPRPDDKKNDAAENDEETPEEEGDETQMAKKKDSLEETLLKSLPDLDGGKSNPVILRRLSMRVESRLGNGDVLALLSRNSSNGMESNSINIRARIPFSALNSRRPLTTNDLKDVEWYQSEDGDYTERKSLAWEDEYTLRLSGFSEAKSKASLALGEKRKQMQGIRDQIETRLKNLTKQRLEIGRERQRLTKEQRKMLDERQKFKELISEKDQAIEEHLSTISEREETIKEQEETI